VSDIDGDGVDDVIVVSPIGTHRKSGGGVSVFSGSTGECLDTVVAEGKEADSLDFGWGAAVYPSAADGQSKLIVSAPGTMDPWGNAWVYGLAGGKSGLKSVAKLSGREEDVRFGHSIAVLGDVTGDGVSDLAISAVSWSAPTHEGAVYILDAANLDLVRRVVMPR
jgi:hypothetical protein